MKKLNYEQFQERAKAVMRAKNIFVDSGITNNVSVAFDIYKYVFEDWQWQTFITERENQYYPGGELSEFEPIECPDCGSHMYLQPLPPEDEHKTQVICKNVNCETAFRSKLSLKEWRDKLKREAK